MNLLDSRLFSGAMQVTIAFTSLLSVAVIAQTPSPRVVSPPQQQTAKSGAIADPLEIKLERAKIGLADGKESRSPAATAKPGDILEEVATYTNKSAAALKGLEATLPVPVNTELVRGSMSPANGKASTDGKNFSAIPLTRKIKQSNGVEVEQTVPLSDYRYLRWYPGDLAAQKSLVFSARFKVANDISQAVSAVKR